MTIVARKVRATPYRSASEAWSLIVELLAPHKESTSRTELESVTGIASSLIADEAAAEPIVVYGSGPRVRIYCLYDEKAMDEEEANETALAFTPTEEDWQVSLPCPLDDLTWVQEALKNKSQRITARDMTTAVAEASDEDSTTKAINVDREAFFRP